MVCLRGGVIFTGNGKNLAESGKFDIILCFDMSNRAVTTE